MLSEGGEGKNHTNQRQTADLPKKSVGQRRRIARCFGNTLIYRMIFVAVERQCDKP
ncbi:hypothetical protein THICB2_310091 [Thiomonas sp. CB2]|nr:hypothetical protein THICB2_310091 [Thiomonas sp. CB2]CQR42788.1 hypothetical protein THICB3300088 [Thiomonas sp. CB3]